MTQKDTKKQTPKKLTKEEAQNYMLWRGAVGRLAAQYHYDRSIFTKDEYLEFFKDGETVIDVINRFHNHYCCI